MIIEMQAGEDITEHFVFIGDDERIYNRGNLHPMKVAMIFERGMQQELDQPVIPKGEPIQLIAPSFHIQSQRNGDLFEAIEQE